MDRAVKGLDTKKKIIQMPTIKVILKLYAVLADVLFSCIGRMCLIHLLLFLSERYQFYE